ncbi:hypothetical protein MCOR14_006919 [Pyricularia oryzae]|uniref:Uncharacterized protein n=1 Tax=Pyricularia oryzae TaxID=318829 RepID=A0A4P7MWC1_PYROR|nr:hypothetical protein MCOR34_010938 [Pyricularia oryzae]KAI6465420.1 hypothetical protein MCOR17_005076 [Pyricularia oryzae]KAI6507095.1 hypothetical protein MCOR13_003044 [Pyricularia oryzae]KAI6580242.1 hypothetical protein MCOR04_005781 [Pyricularia oryzae]KAI6633049.1 hypothetical protein MCOR14_006919 [Pyricularia oryzae]
MRISSTRLTTNPKVSVSPLLSSLILQSPYAQQPQSRFRGRFLHAMASDSPQLGVTNGKPTYQPRYIDIGINLADPIFRGRYGGKQRHPDDLAAVVQRAKDVGCTKLIVTGSSFKSSRDALKLAQEFPGTVYSTAGVHPCSSAIFGATHPHHHEAEDDEHTAACDPDPEKPVPADDEGTPDLQKTEQIVADLDALVRSAGPGLVAFGEFGLDYDRLHYCPKKLQLHSFSHQLDLVVALQKEKLEFPLFLHSRAAHADFVSLLKEKFGNNLSGLARGGVVHSFTGTAEEARELMDLGLYIGINGCSFKTAENCDVVREIRLDRIMIETDGPWCEVRPSHEGWKYLVEDAKRKAADEEQVAAAAAAATVDGNSQPPATDAPTEPANGDVKTTRQKKPKQQQQPSKKGQKKASEVPERFKSVKKEKWEEGCMVKSRNEPCTIERIAAIVAGIKGVSVEEVAEAAWANTTKVFQVDA